MAVVKRQTTKQHGDDADTIPGVHLMTAGEGSVLFDQQAWALLGISGAEFLRRWDRGDYQPVPDTVDGRKIRRLVMLMPFVRRTHA